MSKINKAAHTINAQVLRDETVISANTNDRVYQLLKDIIDSMVDYQQFVIGTATGVNTLVATIPGIESYAEDAIYFIRNTNSNSGASTLNITGVGAKAIKTFDGSDLIASDLLGGATYILSWKTADDFFRVIGGGGSGGGTVYFLGVFASLVALQTAHPTANPGEYAYVDVGIGTDIALYIWDDDDADWILSGSGGGGIPGGSDTQVQFNDGGIFGGDTGLVFNKTTNALTLGGALQEAKGSDIASAGTTDIGAATGNYVDVTGTTTITALGTIQAGTRRIVRFTGILILTHNATSLILPTGANITTAAGDVAVFVSLGSGNWRCVGYTRASGVGLNDSNVVHTTGNESIAGNKTFTDDVLIDDQKGASTIKNGLLIDDTGKITKVSWKVHDTTNQKITSTGVDDLEATTQEEWKNNSGTSIMKILNGLKVQFGGTSAFLEVNTGITSGNAGIVALDDLAIAFRLKDEASFDYFIMKSDDAGYGKASIIKQKQVNDYGQGFETIRNQYKLVLPSTTAAAAHIVGSISVPSGYGLMVHVHNAFAFATNGHAQTCEPFSAVGTNAAGTTSGTSTSPTAVRLTATTGGFSAVWNNTTDTLDLTFTNETGTGRQYDVLMDVSYILYPLPV